MKSKKNEMSKKTPKAALKAFMAALEDKDFKTAHEQCTESWKVGHSLRWLKEALLMPENVYIGKVVSTQGLRKEIYVSYESGGVKYEAHAGLIKEIKPFHTSEKGTWGVNPITIIGKPKATKRA